MRYLLIYNPTSKQGRSIRNFRKLLHILDKKHVDFKYIYTSKKDEAIEIARNSKKDDYDVVVAVGGDGTICETITGLMQQTCETRPKLGVIHIGTSPDFNRFHNLPIILEDAIEVLLKGKIKKIDIGKISHLDMNKSHVIDSYFGSSVNIGLGPDIASKSNGRYRKFLGDFLGTLTSTIVSLYQFKPSTLKIIIDGKEKEFERLFNLTIGKDPYLASGMRVPLEIQSDDGKMYCLSIQGKTKTELLKNLWRLYKGNILDYPGAKLSYCKYVKIESNKNSKIEFDGDFRGYLPAKIELVPKSLEIIVKS